MNAHHGTSIDNSDGRQWLVIFVGFALLYGLSATPNIQGGDAGLFATIFADGGYAHPPGYPLYAIILRLFAWLPASTPTHGASIVTALLGAGSVATLYVAARAWGAGRAAGWFGAIAFGVSTHVWLFHTQPEVFALNHLIAATILFLAAPGAPANGHKRAVLLGLAAGLGLANHHTIVFIAPVGFYGVYLAVRESGALVRTLALGAAGIAAGLLPYGWLVYVSQTDAGWHWGDGSTLGGVVHHFLRMDYGTFRMTAGESPDQPFVQIAFFGVETFRDMHFLPALLAIYGVAARMFDGSPTEEEGAASRVAILCLAGALLLAGPVFVTQLTRVPEGLDYLLVRRFHLMPELFIALLAGIGADTLYQNWARTRVLRVGLPAAIVIVGLPYFLEAKRVHHAPTVDQYLTDVVTMPPSNAVIVGTGDHNFFGVLHKRRAQGVGRDLAYVDARLLAYEWYAHRVEDRLDLGWEYRGSEVDTDAFFAKVAASGRPLFVTGPFHDSIFQGWATYPHGPLIRVLPAGDPPPRPVDVYHKNLTLLRNSSITTGHAYPSTSWARFVLEDYAATWRSIADVLERANRPRESAHAREIADSFLAAE